MKTILITTIAIVLAIATQPGHGQTTDLWKDANNLIATNRQKDKLSQYKSYVYTWKINISEAIASQNNSSFDSPLFPVFGYPHDAKARLYFISGDVNISLGFLDEVVTGDSIPFKVVPSVTFTLKDLSGSGKDIAQRLEYCFLTTLNYNELNYEALLWHTKALVGSVYYNSGSIEVDIAIDPPSVANAVASNDGTLTVAIDNYSLRKQSVIDNLDISPESAYFYTSPGGYRVNVVMDLYGYGKYEGVGLSAEIGFLTGENDSNLSDLFPHQIIIIVFNQVDSTKHYVKTVQTDLKSYPIDFTEIVDLLSRDDLETKGFLVDDTFYYKVIIRPL